ncbi:trypsin-like serine protease [Nonomuraea sp. NN258]|uniref:S1 family peptidase n=1 Tax=Nonomuraea antri TaxID=2730852 RepID=UPI0015694683|nr:S1 family peptidase [Nonomuraea antri]NRQ38258.1 trypsin-like serine protease [Nonomuraea antri]
MALRRDLPLLVALLLLCTWLLPVPAHARHAAAYSVRGGDAYYTGATRCTIGAAVRGGYVTTGDCGSTGSAVAGFNRVAQGTVRGAVFPGSNMGWVAVNANWVPRGVVNDGRGGEIAVRGAQQAPVGATVCRSGSTTGWHCGTLLRRNAVVNYPQGTVYGLIETNVCAEPGDRGGPLMWNGHVQGLLVGFSGNCTTGGRSFYQPITPILQAFGLTLLAS